MRERIQSPLGHSLRFGEFLETHALESPEMLDQIQREGLWDEDLNHEETQFALQFILRTIHDGVISLSLFLEDDKTCMETRIIILRA